MINSGWLKHVQPPNFDVYPRTKTRKTKTIGAFGDLSRLYQLVKRVSSIPMLFP